MSALLERLNTTTDPDPEDVRAYLQERADWALENGVACLSADQFMTPTDLEEYRTAAAWWPTDAPGRLRCPTLPMVLNACCAVGAHPPQTFSAHLRLCAAEVCAWLEAEGRSVVSPNESPEERRRRRVREAVARSRALAREAGQDPRAAEVRVLHAAYMDACAERRRVWDEHTELVRTAEQAWRTARDAL